jgi:UDP-2,3-diacylglucosamine pyrophosphatase LpxH
MTCCVAPSTSSAWRPQLDGLDEVIFLGDLLDLLFGRLEEGVAAAGGLLDLLRERLQGRRLVFVAGNHDHHLRLRQAENVLELRIATGRPAEELDEELRRRDFFRAFLERRLEGVEIDIRYPAYRFGEVLLTHGHYLDPHARRAGSVGSRLLTGALWAIASGGRDDPRTVDDYEGTTTLLTELLFTIAQLPHGTAAQRSVFGLAQRVGRLAATASAPRRAADRLRHGIAGQGKAAEAARARTPVDADHFERARASEHARRRRRRAPAGATSPAHHLAHRSRPSDPRERSLDAFAQVVETLGWAAETDKIVFGHTHQPLADRRAARTGGVRYWNTGCWFYEPVLSSHAAFVDYLRRGGPERWSPSTPTSQSRACSSCSPTSTR